MNKVQAKAWVNELTQLLSGRNLITVAVTPIGYKVEVRQNQKFHKAYFVEHSDGDCVVALSDTYGVMTGAEKWEIDPDRRTVHAQTTNGLGEILYYTWTIADDDEEGTIWESLHDAQKRLWRVR